MPIRLLSLYFLMVPVFFTTARAGTRADIIIVESLESLTVFDRYQQEIPLQQKKRFPPFAAFIVEDDSTVLGDGITAATKVRHEGQVFYFLGSTAALVAGRARPVPSVTVHRNCPLLDDTIVVLNDNALTISVPGPGSTAPITLKSGEHAIRLFRSGNRFYIKRPGSPDISGWSTLQPHHAWKPYAAAKEAAAGINAQTGDKIIARVERANSAYRDFFDEFNRITGQNRIPPRWTIERNPDTLRIILDSERETAEKLERSTRAFVRDIENICMGASLVVARDRNIITIREQPR